MYQVFFVVNVFPLSVQQHPVQHGRQLQCSCCLQRRWEMPSAGSRYETEALCLPVEKEM